MMWLGFWGVFITDHGNGCSARPSTLKLHDERGFSSTYDVTPLIRCVLSQPRFWAVEVTALCLRTKREKGRVHAEWSPAMMQTQLCLFHLYLRGFLWVLQFSSTIKDMHCSRLASLNCLTLVDFFTEMKCPVSERLKVFYSCRAPAYWDLQDLSSSIRVVVLLEDEPSPQSEAIQAKEFNLCFLRPENFVSHGLRVLQVPFGKLQEKNLMW
ncbi:hypothetical protein QTP86_010623 [Hemibagrus guttatus]|nr:hypothetical protein QTP86_010623 [Hemibagrus guttatus]